MPAIIIIKVCKMESIVKLIVLGDPGVGKTSIISRFIRGEESKGAKKQPRISQYDPDVSVKEVVIDDMTIKVTSL